MDKELWICSNADCEMTDCHHKGPHKHDFEFGVGCFDNGVCIPYKEKKEEKTE